jgi:hypothetical protein
MGEERKFYKILVGNPEGNGPLERRRHIWEDGIRMDLGKIGFGVQSGCTWLRIGIIGGLL